MCKRECLVRYNHSHIALPIVHIATSAHVGVQNLQILRSLRITQIVLLINLFIISIWISINDVMCGSMYSEKVFATSWKHFSTIPFLFTTVLCKIFQMFYNQPGCLESTIVNCHFKVANTVYHKNACIIDHNYDWLCNDITLCKSIVLLFRCRHYFVAWNVSRSSYKI